MKWHWMKDTYAAWMKILIKNGSFVCSPAIKIGECQTESNRILIHAQILFVMRNDIKMEFMLSWLMLNTVCIKYTGQYAMMSSLSEYHLSMLVTVERVHD